MSANADMLHQDECEATPPYYPIAAYTMLQEGITTCESLEKERGSDRGGPISCFLACQCSFVLITPAAAAPPARHVSLLFSSFVGRRAVGATDRPTDRIDSGSLGVARGHASSGFYRHSAQHNTAHMPHTYTTAAAVVVFLRCTFTFLDLLQEKVNEARDQQLSRKCLKREARISFAKILAHCEDKGLSFYVTRSMGRFDRSGMAL